MLRSFIKVKNYPELCRCYYSKIRAYNLWCLRICISFVVVAVLQRVEASPEERVSLVEITTIEQRETPVEVLVEDAQIKQELSETGIVARPQAVKEIEDDWCILLNVPIREAAVVPQGICQLSLTLLLCPSVNTHIFILSLFCDTQCSFIVFVISYHGSGLS